MTVLSHSIGFENSRKEENAALQQEYGHLVVDIG
jgi:hypothetical protein